MTPHTRFVSIPADRLVGLLEEIGAKVEAAGGGFAWRVQGRERVFDLTVPGAPGQVRVFTSLAVGEAEVRDCGKDAVRVCVGALFDDDFKPTEKGTKILRTAPKGAEDRAGAFLSRLQEALRGAYRRARAVTPCPQCGRPMATRKGRNGAFLGCTGYPECRGTKPLG